MGIGGTIDVAGLKVSMVPAIHTSSLIENDTSIYLGEPVGFVVRTEDGEAFYFAGDTAVFGDMRLIAEMHAPRIGFLPIGDHFTMGPDGAARAAGMLGLKQVVPMHYGTFPVLTGTPDRLRELLDPGIEMLVLEPGQTAS
jgi:L-ascorbate metabolism protein UlaG (beta-lactamase superfamily)